jgi:glycosyltransferase involved in cell wall biosynthesis
MSSPRIAFFLLHLAGGGAERVAVMIGGSLLERGLRVDYVLAQAAGPLLQDIPTGARLVDLRASRTLTALPGLTNYLRREKPFALIALPDHTNLVALWSKLLANAGTRVVITNHVNASLSIRNTPKLQEKLYPVLLRVFQRAAHAVVAVSTGAADDLAHRTGIPRERITVIYNPVFHPGVETLKARPLDHPWFADGQPPVILAAGRLTQQKDFATLLRAFSFVRQKRPARLVILGEGVLREQLAGLAKDLRIDADFDLPGFVNNPYAYMARCKVFVVSSAWEGFGNVLVEAMASGAQVVSTDCPSGPAEILENGKYGRLVPVGDPDALATAIQGALDQPLSTELLLRRARTFSVEAATEKYLRAMGLA